MKIVNFHIFKENRRHWENSFRKYRGFWLWSFSIGNYGIMICRPFRNNDFITIYKLI